MNKPSKRREARIQRLEQAIAGVEKSIRRTAAEMRSALASAEWEEYRRAAASCLGPVLTPQDKAEFAKYKRYLRRGDALYARLEKLSVVGHQALRRERLSWDARREYASAWETLEQLLIQNLFVQTMLDRPFEDCATGREEMVRPLGSASEFLKQDDFARKRELLRCQHNALLASLCRLREQDAPVAMVGYSAGRDESLGWDALFGFTDRATTPGLSVIDDSWPSNTDASLLSHGAYRELL